MTSALPKKKCPAEDLSQIGTVYRGMRLSMPMLWLTLAVAMGCKEQAPRPEVTPTKDKATFQPAESQLVPGDSANIELLADVNACADCHQDVVNHWTNSPHGRASFDNPWYRATIDAFRKERGNEASRFCAGCHDPLLLLSGKIDGAIDASDPDAVAGITCLVCHGARQADAGGNGSYTLTTEPIVYPDPADPEELAAHRTRVAIPLLRQGEMCGSCHRSFVGERIGNPHHFVGVDDLGAWKGSAYAQSHASMVDSPVEAQTCQRCHMKSETAHLGDQVATDGLLSSHRWPASHSALAAQNPNALQMAAVRDSLKGAATIDIPAVAIGKKWAYATSSMRLRGNAPITIDVAIRNQKAGHRFPGGTRDLQDTWVELKVRDAKGKLLLQSGAEYRQGPDENAFVLRSVVLDENAEPESLHLVHRFMTPAFDRTIAARDVAIVRYRGRLPKRISGNNTPLQIEARLLHRKHSLEFQRFACSKDQGTRADMFRQTALAAQKQPLDACAPQPIIEVAEAIVQIGKRSLKADIRQGDALRPRADRLYEYAIGLLHDVQERVESARPVLREAQKEYASEDHATQLGRVEALYARLESRQAKIAAMERHLKKAEASLGPTPALDRIAGDGYAATWKWNKALVAYRSVAATTPNDWRSWLDVAKASGSLDLNEEAIAAADKGIALAPRQPNLWRSKALALQALGLGDDAEIARQFWLRYRAPDEQPVLLAKCESKNPVCRRDRQPIPLYPLVPLSL